MSTDEVKDEEIQAQFEFENQGRGDQTNRSQRCEGHDLSHLVANIVPIPKKDGNIKICVYYRDLNKASPKDDFPLLNIHILINNCLKHELQSFVDYFTGYHQILMDKNDTEKTDFITPWGVYCYRVMPFGLKNVGATYMRDITTLFHNMIHKEIEVYVDDVVIKSKKSSDNLDDLQKFFERLRRYDLKLNPAKCTFGVPAGKLLEFIVSRRGIELDPSKIKAIQDLPSSKTKKDVMSFLGKLNYISQFIAQSTIICEPIFKLLKKDIATGWTEECQKAFDKIKEYLSNPLVLVPPKLGKPLLLYLSIMDNAFGCVLGQHDDTGRKEQAIYYPSKVHTILLSEFDIVYVTQKAVKEQALANHLAENPVDQDYTPLYTYFLDEEVLFEGEDISEPYDGYEEPDGKPWYYDIKRLLGAGGYPEGATGKQKRTLRRMANHFFLNREILYSRTPNLGLLQCVDATEATRLLEEIHAGTCGPHMNGFMLAKKILRAGYSWMTMERDSIRYVQKCHQCQVHRDFIRVPPHELNVMGYPWPFSTWGMDVIEPIEPPASNGHHFILVAIAYFTKWVEASTHKVVTKKVVADFVRNNLVCQFEIPKSIIIDNGANLNSDLMREICERFKISHRNSTAYRPQMNRAVEATNKNIQKILRKIGDDNKE
ncbi:uncharacterized protein LOC107858317 [Capsicum annuum]|uniref:uncharacterized protein LOC107858317 n=1 Tax=Capsicum annuum TaxID=4072 RepID=UPI001FB11CBD|nr:uncharacterized protein LOC107858317 [Capsicum annuum]